MKSPPCPASPTPRSPAVRKEEIAIEIPEATCANTISVSINQPGDPQQRHRPACRGRADRGGRCLHPHPRPRLHGRRLRPRPRSDPPDGTKLTLGEIAKIIDGFTENPLVVKLNGKRCVMITVMREGKQNAITIGERVKEYIEEKNSASRRRAARLHGTTVRRS
jgi:hypothetical protein